MSEVCNPTKEEKYQYISDTYKSIHGFRPRFDCNAMSHQELDDMADDLSCGANEECETEFQYFSKPFTNNMVI